MAFLTEYKTLVEVIVLLASSVIAVTIFKRIRIPPILSYFFVGIVVGPHGLGWIPAIEDIKFLAEFGVVFLMFTIGLEFSLPKLKTMKGAVFGLGAGQMIVTTVLFCLLAMGLGQSFSSAIIIGAILAMSSTAIVSKQLIERLELNARHGHFAVGVLLFQDLAVIPFLVIIPILALDSSGSVVVPLLLSLAEATVILIIMLAAGRWFLGPILHEVASARSSELFTLTVLLLSLAAALVTGALGLSLALGGFVAGMALGETAYRHQVETDIRPFQDVLLGLFFVTIGMLINVSALQGIWYWVVVLTITTILAKAVIVFILASLSKAHTAVAFRTGIVLAQCGEFGFVLLALSIENNLLTMEANQIILSTILFTMLISPVLIRYNERIAKTLHALSYTAYRQQVTEDIATDAKYLDDHVIFCGYGRVGQNLARMVESEGYQYIALDLDPITLRDALQAGDNVYFGNCTQEIILQAAGIERARLLVITFDSPSATLKILEQAQKIRLDLPILVRSRDESHIASFQHAGATEVVPEIEEASLMLGAHMLFLLDTPLSRIFRVTQDIRSDRYQLLRGFFRGTEPNPLGSTEHLREQLLAIRLYDGAYAVGATLSELKLEQLDVEVTALRRGGIKGKDPIPKTILRAQDVIILLGTPVNLQRAKQRLHVG